VCENEVEQLPRGKLVGVRGTQPSCITLGAERLYAILNECTELARNIGGDGGVEQLVLAFEIPVEIPDRTL
jgi:hypothetical protein